MDRLALRVDLENVQTINLARVPPEAKVMIFYGITQKKLPEELVVQAQPLGTRLSWVKIAGQGPNALDFHIAYYLGRVLAEHPDTECAIISKDHGFDPLVRHLHATGHKCRRVASLDGAFPDFVRAPDPVSVDDTMSRLLKLLKKEKVRPPKRKSLEGQIKCWFPKSTDSERAMLLRALFDGGHVVEIDKSLSYRI